MADILAKFEEIWQAFWAYLDEVFKYFYGPDYKTPDAE